MSKVVIEKCGSYEQREVSAAIERALKHIGGIEAFVKPGDKVLLKVNLLMRRKPERATTTHPAVVQAVAEQVLKAGAKPVIADSPGGYNLYYKRILEGIYETCGMKEVAERTGAELNYDTGMVDVEYPQGKIAKSFKVIKPVMEADKIISISKIKTHMMTVYSGAVKNLFGIIPGGYKSDYHLRFEDVMDFSNLLVDICEYAKPTLNIMDAVVGMEGYGPTSGKPRQVGLLLASTNPYEMDVAASSVIGLAPEKVPTIIRAVERGVCSGKLRDIEIVGEKVENCLVKGYEKPTKNVSVNFYKWLLPGFIAKPLEKQLKPKPYFVHSRCVGCAVCAKSCPPKAIEMVNGKPVVDLNTCIRCFCCHELCNYEAIDVKRPWFVKLILR